MDKRDAPEMMPVDGGAIASRIQNEAREQQIRLRDFHIARMQTTNRQYALFCADVGRDMRTHAPGWGLSDDNPVVNINWYDAVEYANWLSDQLGLARAYVLDKDQKEPHNQNKYDQIKWAVRVDWEADGFRLPTEAEWEYAARGGRQSRGFQFAGSDELEEVGWFAGNSNRRTQNVAEKKPNELTLYDMSGNVWEWCWDWFEDISASTAENPRGASAGEFRVIRGGSWYASEDMCLVSNRNYFNPHVRHPNNGLRLARSS
jgi:formylglycine-generating enzyme required for sulfatase activity